MALRLPANVPGTPAMFCRSDRDAPRRHDDPQICLATPAMFCRSGCDAPRRRDYPPMCLALPPCFAARAAMPHGAAITRQCVQLLLPCFAARAAMPHGAAITRQCVQLLLPCFAARTPRPHGATITRKCTWLGCRIGQVPRPCKSNLTLPGRARVSPISGLLRRKHAWVCEQTNGGRHGGSCLVPVRVGNVWEQTNGEQHRGAGAVGVSLSSACECKRTANGIGQPPQCRFIVQHPPGFDKIVDMDMSAQCRFMVQHPPSACPEFLSSLRRWCKQSYGNDLTKISSAEKFFSFLLTPPQVFDKSKFSGPTRHHVHVLKETQL
jgi:hypothetical protein